MRRVRPEPLQVDTLVRHLNFVLELARKRRALPPRRRYSRVGVCQREQRGRVFALKGGEAVQAKPRALRIEVNVLAFGAIEELGVDDQLRPREYRPEWERFAPAAVGEDEVGDES